MRKSAIWLCVAASAAMAQYTVVPAGAPPPEVTAAFASMLQKEGAKVVGAGNAVVCEVWFRTAAPHGPKATEEGISIPTIPHGAFVGVLRFTGKGSDRRGQGIEAGVYTLRYTHQPVNGDHLGVAPQRDFLV
ncbi:MAG: hypothetical protein ACRD96_07970, partial [Bryobacteraceae bacterium]